MHLYALMCTGEFVCLSVYQGVIARRLRWMLSGTPLTAAAAAGDLTNCCLLLPTGSKSSMHAYMILPLPADFVTTVGLVMTLPPSLSICGHVCGVTLETD